MALHHHKAPIVTDGLVFSVDASNKLGGNTASTRNLTNPTEVGSFVNDTSVVDGSFDFDGVDDYISFISGNTMYNLSWWFYTPRLIDDSSAGVSNIQLFNWDTTGVQNPGEDNISGILLGSVTSNATAETMMIFNHNPLYTITYIRDNINIGYHNVSLNWNGSNYDIYIDGEQKTVYPGIHGHAPLLTTTYFNIAGGGGYGYSWLGQISTVKIYNKALTPSEIKQNYEATKHKYE